MTAVLEPKEAQDAQRADRKLRETIAEAFSEKARRRLLDFCTFTFTQYERAAHLALIAEKLEAVEQGKIKRLMLFVPPRHGKSELASVRFPAWALGRNPDRRVIITSYGADLAKQLSSQVRSIVEDVKYPCVFPGVGTRGDSRSVESWDIAGARGGVFAAGVGGAMTGYGADILIIDDPIKNAEEAESEAQREKVWDWYRAVARTRLEKDAAIIVIQTRWHQDDLSGRLLAEAKKEGGEQWEIVNLPAIYFEEESRNTKTGQIEPCPLGRKNGEVLWRQKYDETAMAAIQNASGSRVWHALYQGRPRDPKSKLFRREWFQRYRELPPAIEAVGGGTDTATTKKSKGDNTSLVEVVRARKAGQTYYYVDRVFCEKVTVTGAADQILNRHVSRPFGAFHLEANNAGEAFHQRIVERSRERDISCPPIECVHTSTDKVVRASEFQPLVENGTLLFKEGDDKIDQLIDHLVDFTGADGEKDDDIDGLGFAIKAAKGDGDSFIGGLGHSTDPD